MVLDQQQELPHSLEAEKALLGAVLIDPDRLTQIGDMVEPENFYVSAHQRIFEEIVKLSEQNEPSDIVTVAEKLKPYSKDSTLLSTTYLVDLTQNCPVSQNIEYYAGIVRLNYYRRKIILACQNTIKNASSFEGDIDSYIEGLEKEFLSISNKFDKGGIVPWKDVVSSTIKELEEKIVQDSNVTGVPTGFIDLDNHLGGFQKGDLIIVAARPGMGKTAFALNCATNAAKQGKSVAIFTLEMRKEELMMRVLASEARLDSSRLRRGDLSEQEEDLLAHSARQVYNINSNIGIDDTPSITMMELRSRCRRFKKEFGLDFVVIDYLQLIGTSSVRKNDTREREISEISMSLKAMAKELEVPVMALAQLNRGPDLRNDKRPKISDLRESGSIEQDADLIMFLYRDEYYNPQSEDGGVSEVIIGKNRHGSLNTIKLAFNPNFVCFQNLYKGEAPTK